jgi:ribosomal protein S18 acetylase RimI-like enzyme
VLRTYVLEGDALDGYERSDASYTYYARNVDDLPTLNLPHGFTAHTVGADDYAARVAVHRAVWEPSRVTEDVYRHVMQTWPYRADLDCVVEAQDGTFAAYVLCWYDPANQVGEFEPVGTHPAFRRRGLGAAACAYALARLRDAGAEQAIVYASDPAAHALYESVGFRRHTCAVELRKLRG